MRALTRRGRTLLLVGIVSLALGGSVRAEDPPKPPAPAPSPSPKDDPAAAAAATKARLRKQDLLSRANQWLNGRLKKNAVIDCPTCNGRGVVGRRDCPYCKKGRRLSETVFRKTHYEMMSPSWRALPTSKAQVEERYKRIEKGQETLPLFDTIRVDKEKAELVGECHARVPVWEDTDTVPRDTLWVWAVEPASRVGTWFAYSGLVDVDGQFGVTCPGTEPATPPDPSQPAEPPRPPGPAAPPAPSSKPPPPKPPPPPPKPPKPPQPLSADDLDALSKHLAVSGVRPSLEAATLDDETLVLRLRPAGVTTQEQLDEAIAATIIPATKVAMAAQEKKPKAVRLVFLARYRDKVGDVSPRPYETVTMDRELFSQIKFENLSREEALDLFPRDQHTYRLEGLILWWKE